MRNTLRDSGSHDQFIELPLGFLVETDPKNPLWALFGITGEAVYNWGLKHSGFTAYNVLLLLMILQARNPKPEARNSKPETRISKPSTPNPSTLKPEP